MNTNYEFLIPVQNISDLNSILDHLTDDLGIEYTINNSEPTNETYKEMIEYIINFYYNETGNEILKKYPNKIYVMMYGKSDELLNDHFTDIILIETGDILGQVEDNPELKENIVELETFLNIPNIKSILLK
jgi:hypothetical protein